MYTKQDLLESISKIEILPTDTLMVHSSMKAIGEVEGGADTVLDAFIQYLQDDGLLIFPTHTWEQINDEYNVYDPMTEPSCVGILTNLFLKRPGVIRSLHPTHSVAALGKDAAYYTSGEEHFDTPCSRNGCWGKLYDRKAKILFLGSSLKKNTYIHGVEEWNHIPNRLMEKPRQLKIKAPDGRIIDRPFHSHFFTGGDISQNYDKILPPLLHYGVAKRGKIGDAESVLCDAVEMANITSEFLQRNPKIFEDSNPIPEDWY
ncbi:MAG: AAC(3) family N-acetyltransferase [Anaerolineaceae bacterium]|nr:MAG: AAC(3) family N-acetyltransferase [Anaerolineaceae bacterium]